MVERDLGAVQESRRHPRHHLAATQSQWRLGGHLIGSPIVGEVEEDRVPFWQSHLGVVFA